jgi:uncharacterized Fe-S cluster protein YjdI
MDKGDRQYTNGEITVYWKPKECIHAGVCFTNLIEVFNPRKRPWVDMTGASTKQIIEIVDKCPTDALTYKRNNEDATSSPKIETAVHNDKAIEIQVMPNGPLMVAGSFILIGEDGNELTTARIVSFCRCGKTLKAPFCDGTHRAINFIK